MGPVSHNDLYSYAPGALIGGVVRLITKVVTWLLLWRAFTSMAFASPERRLKLSPKNSGRGLSCPQRCVRLLQQVAEIFTRLTNEIEKGI